MNSDNMLLQDILDSCNKIIEFTKNHTLESFQKDEIMQLAVIRLFEIVGEASKNLSVDFKKIHEAIPWKLIVGMRNILVHAYREVNIKRLWTTVNNDVPSLIEYITPLIKE